MQGDKVRCNINFVSRSWFFTFQLTIRSKNEFFILLQKQIFLTLI